MHGHTSATSLASPLSTGFRELFDIPADYAYFDNAAYSLPPRSVKEAALAGAQRRAEPWGVSGAGLEAEAERVRELAGKLFGARTGDVAIVGSTSYGVSTAAGNLGLAHGEVVLVIDGEHHSQVLPWVALAEACGGSVENTAGLGEATRTQAILDRLADEGKPRVSIIAVTPVHWSDGEAIDIAAIAVAARARSARLVVDTTQTAGILPLDLKGIDPDFVVAAGHKWLLGPQGSAILYAAPRHQGGRPLDQHAHARAIDRYAPPGPPAPLPFMAGARRFDSGQRENMILLPIVIAGLEFVLSIGIDTIRNHVAGVTAAVAEGAEALGFKTLPAGQRSPHILALAPPVGDANAIAATLAADKVFLSARQGLLRVAPHLHTGEREVERLLSALRRAIGASSTRP
jgi:selenocysteine lyase/cysteine desulfurase